MPEVDRAHVGDIEEASALALARDWAPEAVVGNPPFSKALRQLQDLRAACPRAVVAWLLPVDLYTVQAWAAYLVANPPQFCRPITRRVWPCVRGVAVWEWWPDLPAYREFETITQIRPLQWRR